MRTKVSRGAYLDALNAGVRTALALLRTDASMSTDEACSAAARIHGCSFKELRYMTQSALQE